MIKPCGNKMCTGYRPEDSEGLNCCYRFFTKVETCKYYKPEEEQMEEQKWTEKEIAEAWENTDIQPHECMIFDDFMETLKKPKPEDNPVFKELAKRLSDIFAWNGIRSQCVSRETLAKACEGLPPLMPENLSDRDWEIIAGNSTIATRQEIDKWLQRTRDRKKGLQC